MVRPTIKKDLPELRKKFLEYKDPTGYKLAMEYFGDFKGLQRFLKQKYFKNIWDGWQEELRAEIKSTALARIQEIAQEGSAQSLVAAKYLANGEYIEGIDTKKRGRPTTEEVTGELKRQVKAVETRQNDYNRMTGLTVVQGGKK